MTKQHFIAIAAEIKAQLDRVDSEIEKQTIRNTSNNLCHVFQGANPRFDVTRFLEACGIN